MYTYTTAQRVVIIHKLELRLCTNIKFMYMYVHRVIIQ